MKKNTVALATPVLVAMVMPSWKNMDYIICNVAHSVACANECSLNVVILCTM